MPLPYQLISAAFVKERDEVNVVHLTVPTDDQPVGTWGPITVNDTKAFAKTLQRDDITVDDDGELVGLYHQRRGLLAVLSGPKTPPRQLSLVAAVDNSSTVPTVVLGGTEDEPQTWLVFETTETTTSGGG